MSAPFRPDSAAQFGPISGPVPSWKAPTPSVAVASEDSPEPERKTQKKPPPPSSKPVLSKKSELSQNSTQTLAVAQAQPTTPLQLQSPKTRPLTSEISTAPSTSSNSTSSSPTVTLIPPCGAAPQPPISRVNEIPKKQIRLKPPLVVQTNPTVPSQTVPTQPVLTQPVPTQPVPTQTEKPVEVPEKSWTSYPRTLHALSTLQFMMDEIASIPSANSMLPVEPCSADAIAALFPRFPDDEFTVKAKSLAGIEPELPRELHMNATRSEYTEFMKQKYYYQNWYSSVVQSRKKLIEAATITTEEEETTSKVELVSSREQLFVVTPEGFTVLRAATLEKLVDYLLMDYTYENDASLPHAIAITHELFCDTKEFLRLLFMRFNNPPPFCKTAVCNLRLVQFISLFVTRAPHLFANSVATTSMQTVIFTANERKQRQQRMQENDTEQIKPSMFSSISVIDNFGSEGSRTSTQSPTGTPIHSGQTNFNAGTTTTATTSPNIDGEDGALVHPRKIILDFIKPIQTAMPESYNKIMAALNNTKRLIFNPKTSAVLKKRLRVNDVLFAQQLTVFEWNLFVKLEMKEFFHLSWSKADLQHSAHNVCRMIQWSNVFCSWATHYIVEPKQVQKRAERLAKVLTLADNLGTLNNFNGMMEVFSCVSKIAVFRLKQTWARLSKRSTDQFQRLQDLFNPDRNFFRYRSTVASAQLPRIPFLGIHLSDLTFIDQGNKDTVVNNQFGESIDLINIDKWRKFGGVLYEITSSRVVNYNFVADGALLESRTLNEMLQVLVHDNEQVVFSDEELLKLSHENEEPAHSQAPLDHL